jgi:hypothetical protein
MLKQIDNLNRARGEKDSTAPPRALPGGAVTNEWQSIQDAWREAKDFLDEKVDEFTDLRTVRRYSRYTRYNYKEIMDALEIDSRITPKQRLAASNIASAFFQNRIKQNPSNDDASSARKNLKTLRKE